MKRFPIVLVLMLTAACSMLPRVDHPDGREFLAGPSECRDLFLQGSWQFQHTIEATLSGGRQSVLIGVSRVSAENSVIRTVLMTIEGLVVFDAEYDREIRILRALSPFDSEAFAQGLFNDIRLIFFTPEGAVIETGTLQDGSSVCRYRQPGRQVVDVIRKSESHWELRQFNRRAVKKRTVEIYFNDHFQFDVVHIPYRVTLTAHGYNGYTLDMELLEAVRLKD